MKRANNEMNPWMFGNMSRAITSKLIPVRSNVLKFRLSERTPIKNCANRLTASPVPVIIPICEYERLKRVLKTGKSNGTSEITPSLKR